MIKLRGWTPVPLIVLVAGLGCGGGDAGQPPKTAADSAKQMVGGLVGGLMKMAEKQESLDRANPYVNLRDPCVLVSRAEAEKYLGPLAGDPYRVDGAMPSEEGHECLYRGANGQSITIDPNNFSNGRMGMKMMGAIGGMMNQALVTESGSADTLDGDWDEVRWTFGQLEALKGDVLITVDVSSSTAGPVGAADLANTAIHHLDHPLAYDGAKAVAHAPGPLVTPKDPCSLVTRAEAAAILGPITAEPVSGKSGCTYTVASGGGGTRPVELQVTWTGGFKAMNNAKMTTRMVNKSLVDPARAEVNAEQTEAEIKKDPESQQFVEKMRGVMRSLGGPVTEEGTMKFKTDTAGIKGPWDEAAILNGFTFMAVKKDVAMSVGLQYLDQKQAEALVAKAISRL